MIIVSAQAIAAADSVAAAPVMPSSQDQLIEVSLALAAVLALIYGIAWLIKRKQVIHGISNIPMKTIGVLPMGVKEKIILIEVGGKQILLGMTASNINTLATFDEPIVTSQEQENFSFSQKLKSIMAQQSQKNSNPVEKANHDED